MLKLKNDYGFTLIELAVVLIIISTIISITAISSSKIIKSAKISHAINITAQADFINDDGLILWLETSNINRYGIIDQNNLSVWNDLSKSSFKFVSDIASPQTLKTIVDFENNKNFKNIKGFYFDINKQLISDRIINVSNYTAFVVGIFKTTTGTIFKSGNFSINVNNSYNGNFLIMKDYGNKNGENSINLKIKNNIKDKDYSSYSTSIDFTKSNGDKSYLGGNNFKGTIIEIIIFDRILKDKEIKSIENYLTNKYVI
jgi:prepilin-type N-terminal cleavage/methylation domain-containing protein